MFYSPSTEIVAGDEVAFSHGNWHCLEERFTGLVLEVTPHGNMRIRDYATGIEEMIPRRWIVCKLERRK